MKNLSIYAAVSILALSTSVDVVAAGHPAAATPMGGNPHPAGSLGPSTTGQPNQHCGSATAPNTPGNAASAPGSPFNPGGNAGTHYAGTQPQNSINTASVAQYDVACRNVSR